MMKYLIENSRLLPFVGALVLLLPLVAAAPQGAPIDVSWTTLGQVRMQKVWLEEEGLDYWQPTFSAEVMQLAGQNIRISGYVIPVDVEAEYYVLSANPFANCFFCGNAGPETVMELKLRKKHRRFKTDEYLTFGGRLRLNEGNVTELTYILEEADLER